MGAKQKARELLDKFRIHQPVWEVEGDAKQCALIAVDEIIASHTYGLSGELKIYWQEVKKYISYE